MQEHNANQAAMEAAAERVGLGALEEVERLEDGRHVYQFEHGQVVVHESGEVTVHE